MTKLEADFHRRVRDYGCIICKTLWGKYTPAEIHHMLSGGRRMGEMFVLGLCPPHHRTPVKGVVCRSQCQRTFEKAYGSEASLYEATKRLIGWQS